MGLVTLAVFVESRSKWAVNAERGRKGEIHLAVKTAFRASAAIVQAIALSAGVTALATSDDPVAVVNNLGDLIFGHVHAIGLILLGFGIVQIGLSFKSHDPSQRVNAKMSPLVYCRCASLRQLQGRGEVR